MRKRVATIKLFYQGYLGRDGNPTPHRNKAVQLTFDDACKFMGTFSRVERGDFLKSMSLEVLAKRRRRVELNPLSTEEFQIFIGNVQTVRLLNQAAQLERQAEAYLREAQGARDMAKHLTDKAVEIRRAIGITR